MSTINQFRINGTIDTSQNVLANLMLLAQSSGCWITYDSGTGKWSVVLKQPGTSVKSFNNSNMIGEINISSSSLNDIYNICEVSFPNKDLDNTTDYVIATMPDQDRFQNELDQKLNINFTTINNGAQAQLIAAHDLKQSRFDKVIDFKTDYTALGEIEAGDIIDITSSMYGFNQKLFRIVQIIETDTDDGQLIISVNASEYDADVYNISGLTIENRSKSNGIPPKITNDDIKADEQAAEQDNLKGLLLATLGTGLFNMLADYLSGSLGGAGGGGGEGGGGGVPPPVENPVACPGTSMGLGRSTYTAPPPDPAALQCGGTNGSFTEVSTGLGDTSPYQIPYSLPALNIPRNVTINNVNYTNSDSDNYTLKVKPSVGTVFMDLGMYGPDSGSSSWAPTFVTGYTKDTISGSSLKTTTEFTVTSETFNNSDPNLVTSIKQVTVTPYNSFFDTITPTSKTTIVDAEIIVGSTGSVRGYTTPTKVYRVTEFTETVTSNYVTKTTTRTYAVQAKHGTLSNFNFSKVRLIYIPSPARTTQCKITGNTEVPLEIHGSYNFMNQVLGTLPNIRVDPESIPGVPGRNINIEYQLLVNGQPRGAPQIVKLGYKNPNDYYNPYQISIT